ncbi:MAG: helix-turn-helix transcriptional regulator [Phyllobacteriaceae bacterium]|nr:helix-turn-helix transcriptional regulator [Phyllobacteriaceae bacterium]
MSQFIATDYRTAEPLVANAGEMATAHIKIIVADRGFFRIAGRKRTAFVVGSRVKPIDVSYSDNASCIEFVLAPWVATAVLGVSGGELSHAVHDAADLAATPFLAAIQCSDPHALDVARLAYMNWSAGRGTADAQIAQKVWQDLRADPTRRLDDVADGIGLSDRRVRAAVRSETGLSPAQLRRLIRLEKSSRAISNSNDTLASIAVDSGYADQSHMNRDLIELAGISPSNLRRATAIRRSFPSDLSKIDPR